MTGGNRPGAQPDEEGPEAGLAAERTDLAWDRSSLALMACGALILRGAAGASTIGGPRGGHLSIGANQVVGVTVLGLGLLVSVLGAWRLERARRRGLRPARPSDMLPLSVGVALVGTAAFLVGLLTG